jgi:hypothetical protein
MFGFPQGNAHTIRKPSAFVKKYFCIATFFLFLEKGIEFKGYLVYYICRKANNILHGDNFIASGLRLA